MMRLPHKSRLKFKFWSNSVAHLYAYMPNQIHIFLNVFLFNLVRYFYISFFWGAGLTEELFDEVGPALS